MDRSEAERGRLDWPFVPLSPCALAWRLVAMPRILKLTFSNAALVVAFSGSLRAFTLKAGSLALEPAK